MGRATRSTRQKRAIAGVLEESDGFLSAREVHGRLLAAGGQAGLTTVYNQLRALAEDGTLDVLRTHGGESLYRRCQSGGHHHHLVCRVCGTTVEVEEPALERWAERVASQHGFRSVSHDLEITGTCARCDAPARAGSRIL